ncbi:hypothetical protein LJU02_00300 [Corynebacterium pseudotuberculosis]|uniref:Uncharacterized protein n=1 Tax=Corynebacterium pseudotuberculosis 258 TaxID=1168865 RepID=A0AAU8PMJ7_CORPS|nr:hypothetical protein [Corynebacterium pseudotuberculosis]AER68175.1 Hypothetical protein Cp106_0048 [Corynebacterium pseudotuberculosis 1/06-A]AEQ05624.1 hypothetical protein CPCIP5297_00305 [Corynebacterium pseudotuberculosis CIP 52.97]AFB71392.1 hypothetical protein CP316_00305 [Corynebacterium pseudotuberculosis 316]AFK15713.1 hypothetical protein CP258_00305 [Corynebacterium pseudotuberculosis 258]AKS12405.1 Hypothetical protein CpE19_0061 [Corynebacterium pseudotuberculosis]
MLATNVTTQQHANVKAEPHAHALDRGDTKFFDKLPPQLETELAGVSPPGAATRRNPREDAPVGTHKIRR